MIRFLVFLTGHPNLHPVPIGRARPRPFRRPVSPVAVSETLFSPPALQVELESEVALNHPPARHLLPAQVVVFEEVLAAQAVLAKALAAATADKERVVEDRRGCAARDAARRAAAGALERVVVADAVVQRAWAAHALRLQRETVGLAKVGREGIVGRAERILHEVTWAGRAVHVAAAVQEAVVDNERVSEPWAQGDHAPVEQHMPGARRTRPVGGRSGDRRLEKTAR